MAIPKGKILIDKNDIIGKRLGKLEVIAYCDHRYDITNGGYRLRHYYKCKCDCGEFATIQRSSLINELTHSCGCLRRIKRS